MAPQDPVIPPIADSDKNKRLDSKELLEQLAAEEKNGQDRVASEKVHAVLDAAGFRDMTNKVNQMVREGGADTGLFENVATELENRINGVVENILEQKKKHPDIKGFMKEQFEKLGLTGETLALNISDINNTIDFAETYKATFPKGVTIAPEDVPQLLAHFGKLQISTTPPKGNSRG